MESVLATARRAPWNKSKALGQKAPLKLKDICAIRVRLQERLRELALLDLGINSKLGACDLVRLRVRDVCHGDRVAARAMVLEQKNATSGPVRNYPATGDALLVWLKRSSILAS